MPYKVLRFEEEKDLLRGPDQRAFVAVVEDSNFPDEQPFRVRIENFRSAKAARAEVDAWIKAREMEDEARAAELERSGQKSEEDATLTELNESLKD